MAGDVGLGEQAQARDTARAGKLMPLRFANGTKLHAADHAVEQSFHCTKVAQRFRGATESLNDPLDSAHAGFTIKPAASHIPGRTCWCAG